jgi:hypothetical protein
MGKYNFIRERQNAEPWNRAQLLPQVETPSLPTYQAPALKDGELPPPVQNYRRDQFLNSPPTNTSAPTTPPTQGREIRLDTPTGSGATTPQPDLAPGTPPPATASRPVNPVVTTPPAQPNYTAAVDPTAPLFDPATTRPELRAAEAAAGIDGDHPNELPLRPPAPASEPARVPGFVRDGLR